MSYEIALSKAWEELKSLNPENELSVKFLADEYSVDTRQKKIFSLACNIPAKDFTAILLLHYLAKKIKGLPQVAGEWLTFRELAGIEGYASAFHDRAIKPIVRKYGTNPEGMLSVLRRLPAKEVEGADVAIVLEAFGAVPVLIKLWRQDEEFGPQVNLFFDQNITGIFCTEDIIVLAGIIAATV